MKPIAALLACLLAACGGGDFTAEEIAQADQDGAAYRESLRKTQPPPAPCGAGSGSACE